MEHLIRAATASDAPSLVKLVNSAYRGEEARKGWTHEADLIEGTQRIDEPSLIKLINDPKADILMYFQNDLLAGCVYLQKKNELLYLGMLSVIPDIQAKGIGKKLLRASEQYAIEHQCMAIEMNVISSREPLIGWYARNGYYLTEETRPFPTDDRFGRPRQPVVFSVLKKNIHDPASLLRELKNTLEQTIPLYDLSEDKLQLTYGTGKWSVRQILCHLADAETVLYDRIRRTIAEPFGVRWAMDQDAWERNLEYEKMPLPISKELYRATRGMIRHLVKEFYTAQGHKEFVHSKTGLRTLREEMEKVAAHNRHHLQQVQTALRAKELI